MKRVLLLVLSSLVWLVACSPSQTSLPAASDSRSATARSLAIDPRDGRLLRATADGLYQSRDEGKSWERMTLPAEIAKKDVSHVAIRQDQPDIMYLVSESIGIWRSRDAGKSWQKVTQGLTSEKVSALAVHSNGYPRDSRKTLFAWVAGVGMFESQDEGDNWKRSVDQAMGLDNQPVTALTHTPLEGSMNTGWLYATTPAGAYLSMD